MLPSSSPNDMTSLNCWFDRWFQFHLKPFAVNYILIGVNTSSSIRVIFTTSSHLLLRYPFLKVSLLLFMIATLIRTIVVPNNQTLSAMNSLQSDYCQASHTRFINFRCYNFLAVPWNSGSFGNHQLDALASLALTMIFNVRFLISTTEPLLVQVFSNYNEVLISV